MPSTAEPIDVLALSCSASSLRMTAVTVSTGKTATLSFLRLLVRS
jgi:hypothetical protein